MLCCWRVTSCYAPGLSGPSLQDDFWNLQSLGAEGGVHNLVNFPLCLRHDSSPTGRSLSIPYFLIGQDWPPYVQAFKHTNLKLHLLTGALTTIAISATHAVCLNCDERHARSVAYKAIKLAFINRGLCLSLRFKQLIPHEFCS